MLSPWVLAAVLILLAGLLTAWIPHPAAPAGFSLAATALCFCWVCRRFARRRWPRFPPPWIALAAACLWMAAQRLLVPPVAPVPAAQELAAWTAAALISLLLSNEIDIPRGLTRALSALCLAAGAIAVWALVQGLTSHGRVFWIWGPGIPIERVWGPFLYHNKLAQVAEAVLPAAICLAATDSRRRWLWLAAAAALLAVTVVAASRAGVVLLCLEICLCAGLLLARRFLGARQVAFIAAQLLLAAGITVLVAGWETFADRFQVRQMLEDRRFDLNRSSWQMAKAHLPWGAGYGSWPAVYPQYASFDDGRFANQAHNDWLQWLCEGGIPGIAAIAAFLLLAAPALMRGVWGCGAVIVFLHAWVDYPFHQSPPLATLVISIVLAAAEDNGRWLRQVTPLHARVISVSPLSRHHGFECPPQNI